MGKSLNILVCGADIAGLGAAIALQRKGYDVTIIEFASELIEVGAGIQIPLNSSRILISWGLENKYANGYANGEILGLQDINDENTKKFPYWFIYCADYQRILYDVAKEVGARFLLEHRVESVDENGPAVIFKDGQRLNTDLIVGADGIRLKIRHAILKDKDFGAADSPNCAYRATVPAEIMNQDPEL